MSDRPWLVVFLASGLTACSGVPDAREVREGIEAKAATGTAVAALVTDVPFFPSPSETDCGPSALAAVLAKAGAPRDLETVHTAVYDPLRDGAGTSALVRYARAQKVFALVRDRWWLEDLRGFLRAGVPAIVCLGVGPFAPGKFHYVVLKGYDDERRVVLVQDQVNPELAISYDAFFPAWAESKGWALVVASPTIVLPPDGAGFSARELGALGWLAEQRGELAAARRHYKAALAKDPSFEAAAHNLENVERALAARGAGS